MSLSITLIHDSMSIYDESFTRYSGSETGSNMGLNFQICFDLNNTPASMERCPSADKNTHRRNIQCGPRNFETGINAITGPFEPIFCTQLTKYSNKPPN